MKKYTNIILIVFFVSLEIFILSKSQIVINSFSKTLNICLYSLMPTMFFSLLISQILIKLHFENYIPKFIKNIFKKIFNINDNEFVIFILSILCGYPNNSKMLINNKNLNNIIQYTNFVNPIFMIATVGGIYLKNIKLSIIILTCHYLSNIILGFILKNKNINNDNLEKIEDYSFLDIYYSSIKSTIYTLSVIFSNILFFSIINALVTNLIHINEPYNSIIIGIIEFSNGIFSISNTSLPLNIKGLFILIFITFSSFSMHMQIMSINEKIKYTKYFIYRIFNVLISIIFYYLLLLSFKV